MKNFFTILKVRTFLSATVLILFTLFSNQVNATGCYNGPANAYGTAGVGITMSCTNQTIAVASTQYTQFTVTSGVWYTVSTNGSPWTANITVWYYNGSAWYPYANGTNSVTFTGYNAFTGTMLATCYNGTACPGTPNTPTWPGTSTTLNYRQSSPATPGAFSTTWTGDHYVCGSFTTTVPTVAGATYYRLCGSANTSSGCSAYVNGGATYTAGQTVTVSGSDLPTAGTYKYYLWRAFDACDQQSPDGTQDYVRMDVPPVAGTYAYSALYECDGYTRNASGTIVTNSVSGYTGNPQWYWGSSGGSVNVWGGVSATAAGNNCFPYGHASTDADRMWVVLSSGGASCPTVTMPQVLVNPVAPAITNVTAAANPLCGQSTTVLTANGVSGLATTTTWYTATNAGGNNLGTGNTVTVGPGQTYYARVTDVCNGSTQCGGTHSVAVEANLAVATEATAPTITAPADVSTNNSPNNSGNTAEVFATPGSSDGCGGSAATINVLPLPGSLKCWVKADAGVVKDASGNVAIWKDLSGNGNDFSQPTFTSRPTLVSSVMNGNPVIRMTTTNAASAAASKWLYTSTNFSSANYTIFSVSQMQGSQNSRLLASASTNWLFGNWGGAQDKLYCNNWITASAATPTADTKVHMYEMTSTGSSTYFYDYGNAIVSNSATAASPPGQLATSGYLNSSEFSSGDIAEIIVYNTVLSTAQRQIVEGYLAYKYNLQAPLASLQAFQTYAAASNTVNFVATDQAGNKATTTATASKTNYPGPVTTPSTAAAVCNGSNITLTTSGMAPAGNYLNCANSADYLESTTNIPVGSNWTIEAWAKFPLTNTGGAGTWNTLIRGTALHHIIVERNAVGSSNILGVYNGGFYPCSVNGSLNGNQGFDVTTLSAGWHHIAAVGTGGTTAFYIDGVFVGKSASQCTDNIVAIGNYQGGGQQFGAVDEVRIWNTTLSQNTISNNMTQAITASHPNYANMLAYYKMDGNGTDSKAGTYNGTLRGTATASTATAFYTYNWSVTGGGTFSPAASTTAETVTATGLVAGNSGNFSVYASANTINSATVTTAVSVAADPNVTTQPVNAAICPGGTYSPFIVAAGGTPSLTYLWKYSTDNSTFNTCTDGVPAGAVYSNTTSANTFSVSGITASGTYYYACFVSATGQDCNTAQSNSGVLTVYPYPTFTTTPTNILCNGASTGSILVNVTVGTSLFDFSKNAGGTYAGSSNQTSPYTFTALAAGSYDIVVRDAHSCVSLPVSTISLTQPTSLPSFTETHTAVLCNGGSTGTITVTASGGTAGYTYSKDGGSSYQTGNVFSGLASGTYQIKVKDANGCTTGNTSVFISQPTTLSFTSSKTDVVCFGDNNGTITLNGTGGVPPYQYSDDNGGTYNAGTDPYTFGSLSPNTYLVGIRDANSCPTTFVSKTIVEPTVLSFTTSQVDILCNGNSTGSITVTATGGTGTLVYSKNGGTSYQSSNIFSGLAAGAYSIKVKDANLCITAPQSVTINEPVSVPAFTETHTPVICNGGSTGTITVTASGGTPGYTYSKDGGSTYQASNVFTGLSQGTYQIKVKDANDCTTGNTNVSITQPTVVSFTNSETDVVCNGDNNGTITLNGSGGVPPYTYSNDNGSTYVSGSDPYTFTGLSPAAYEVGIKDANDCATSFTTVTVNEPAAISFTTSKVDVLCFGNNTGSITVSASGGTGTLLYSKNGGTNYQVSNVFNGLVAGTYTILVKDANICITSPQSVTINQPAAGVSFTTSLVHVLCNGDNTGSITVNAAGGTPGYTYSDDNGSSYQVSNVFNTLSAGTYLVKVKDASGCTTIATNTNISQPTLVTYTTSFTNVNCNGVGDGTITIDGNGGVPPYQYSINNGATFQFGPDPFTFNNLAAGTYLAGLTDDNGCVKGFTSITIIQPTAITFTTSQVNVLCYGGNNASITVTASGGTGVLTYSKDNGSSFQASNVFSGLVAGTYQIKVKDASGCVTSAQSVTITQPTTALTVTASNGGPYSTTVTASLFSSPSGGTPTYTYNWSGPASFATNPAHTLQNPTRTPTTANMTGTYKVTVTDANGCSATAQTVMNVFDGYVWIGAVSTDWNNNSNWNFQVPDYPDDCTQKAYIQAGTPFAPNVNIPGLTVGALTLAYGATVNLDNDLTLCSNLTGSASGTLSNVTGNGKLIMRSSPSVIQNISGSTKFDATLQVDNSAGVNITSGASQIINALELKAGVLTVGNPNYLTFMSNSSNHSAIIDNFSAGMTGSISGSVKMQRKYDAPTSPSYKTQHYMGSPVDQPPYTAFGANGVEGRVINTLCDEKKAGAGSPYGSMAKYDENWPDAAICNLQGWYIVKTGNTENGRGYSVARSGAGVLSLTGVPNQATNYTRTSLTNSGWTNITVQGHRDTSGWHILSNPWLANLSLNSSGGAGMDNQVAVWQTTGPYAGGYHYYQVGFEPVDIAPFQAFLVHKTSVGGLATYTINGSDRVRTPSAVHFNSMNNDQELAINVDNTLGLRDRTVVAFNTQATDNFDPVYDGNKLWGDPDRLSLYSENNAMPMARNTLTSMGNNPTVPMGFDAGLPGSFTMSFEGLNSFDATCYIMLEDKQTNAWHNVRNGNYVFSGDTTDNLNRFVLHFTPAAVINHTDASCNTPGVIHVEQAGNANWNYVVTNISGTQISNGSLNSSNPITVNAAPGVYTLTLVDNHNYTVVKQIQVSGAQGVQASFVASATAVEQDDDITFTSTSANATNHVWNFGDNNTANGVTVIHSYNAPGVYSATLTADNTDCNGMSTQQITVAEKATTGVNSLTDKSGITIWSNDNTVYVDFGKQPKVEAQIEIYNVLGQQLSNEKYGGSSVYHKQFNNLEAAYVIVRVKNNDEITTKKVFIGAK